MKDKVFKTMRNVVSIVIMIVVIVLVVYLASQKFTGQIATLFGYSCVTVTTGSMEPTIEGGSLIILKEIEEYKENDIITFRDGNRYVTHRIVEINEGMITTKGDANNACDTPFDKSNIVGKVLFAFPKVGMWLMFLSSRLVITIVLIIIAVIAVVDYALKKEAEVNE